MTNETMNDTELAVKQAIITYPAEFPQMLEMSDSEFVAELQFLAAAKLYELGRLSSGRAAQLAGVGRAVFLQRLGQIGVPVFNLRDEEIEAEIASARDLAG